MSPLDGYAIERLRAVDDAAIDGVNQLVPQLKPMWEPVTADGLAELLASESLVFVARHDGRIVGLTVMVPHRHLAGLRYHVEDVVIDAAHRGVGLGRRLLQHAMEGVPEWCGRSISDPTPAGPLRTTSTRRSASFRATRPCSASRRRASRRPSVRLARWRRSRPVSRPGSTGSATSGTPFGRR